MTDASPEVKRWGEMADEYNTKPSEIAFLQSIAQLSAAHRMEACSPIKYISVPTQHDTYPNQFDTMTIEPTPVEPVEHSHRSLELQREQYKDYSVHLERNLFDNP